MKIAITGANGFVGSNLIQHFQSCGHEVYALVRPSAKLHLLSPGTNTVFTNFNDHASLLLAFSGMDVVIHNAGKTKALNHAEMMQANHGITQNIVRAINETESKPQLIYLSSQAASKPSYNNIPVKESDAENPLTSYGESKLAAERAIREQCQTHFTIIRPCSVYGGGDRDFLNLFKMVKRGFSFQIGAVDKYLNMIHVSELAAFINLCLQNSAAYEEIFFATDGQTYRQSDIMHAITSALHKKPIQIIIPNAIAKVVFYVGDAYGRLFKRNVIVNREKMKEIMAESWLADPAKAKQILGWNPLPQLQLHIMETAACYHASAWL
ncbi:MAG: NAD-dependent epimerase/dehydratase family protein [Candidatus Cloacimonas sp.]|jgi:nucleoside-diphosphate-sugar epimerase|nr:NAD-dependent epimerase/dehydratase family protein [Candidatus Cloacimonas sp.]